ncbi:MAG TPA: ABC transporter ATP-binding protein [Flavobacterium sp.]
MLEINKLSFSYDMQVLHNINVAVPQGSHVALIGESGCGKSTLLKLIYGMYDLEQGSISYNGKPIRGPKYNLIPGEDYIKYLAQDFGLMPYITASENVGRFLSNVDKPKKKQRISELLEMVGMTEYANIKPQFLSGGQQQRVALARVLALEPEVLLLDEPFSQVDAFRANSLRRNLFGYLKKNDITCIVATHDAADVLSFADEAVILKQGRIIAAGKPADLYRNPQTAYVGGLFGEINEIPAHLFDPSADKKKMLLLYPSQLKISTSGLILSVKANYFRGSHYLVSALHDSGMIYFESNEPLEEGSIVTLTVVQ